MAPDSFPEAHSLTPLGLGQGLTPRGPCGPHRRPLWPPPGPPTPRLLPAVPGVAPRPTSAPRVWLWAWAAAQLLGLSAGGAGSKRHGQASAQGWHPQGLWGPGGLWPPSILPCYPTGMVRGGHTGRASSPPTRRGGTHRARSQEVRSKPLCSLCRGAGRMPLVASRAGTPVLARTCPKVPFSLEAFLAPGSSGPGLMSFPRRPSP